MQTAVKLLTVKCLIKGYWRSTDLYFILLAFGSITSCLFKRSIFNWWLQPLKLWLMNLNFNIFKGTFNTAFFSVGCLSLQLPSFVPSIISDHGKSVDSSILWSMLEFLKIQLHFHIYCAQASHHSPLHDLAAVQIVLKRKDQTSFFPTRSTDWSSIPSSPSQYSLCFSLRL